jgi:hypothetical protein
LKSVYEDQISAGAQKILGDANQSPPEQSVSVVFNLPQNVLDQLNAGQTARLNLKDLNLFPDSEENLRITDLAVTAMDLAVDSAAPAPNGFSLVFKHSGICELQKDGQTFLFRYYSENTRSAITWKTVHHFVDGSTEQVRPSAASQSLIGALVNKSPQDSLIYTRPAVFADLLISPESNTPGAVVRVKSATVRVQYDFTARSDSIKFVQIEAGTNGIAPQIQVATPDRNGLQNGRGGFERVYDKNTVVTLTAPATEGPYDFVRWEGATFPDPTSPTVSQTVDQDYSLRPVYAATVQ